MAEVGNSQPRRRLEELMQVLGRSFSSTPDWRSAGQKEATPVDWLLGQSSLIDAARQVLPRRVGGYGSAVTDEFEAVRAQDPRVRERTTRVGEYPELAGQPLRPGRAAAAGRQAAQVAGLALKDVTTQGIQNIWWFLNAYEAASSLAGRQAMHGALKGVREPGRSDRFDAPAGSPLSRHHLRFAATFPLILGAASATGTLLRQPGYAAVLPSEEDKRQSADPLSETVMRAVGRTGALLPYDEFVKERPDVSRGEYESYKAFLFGDKSMVKFNPDGIHGAEVNFVGKSVPLLTGVLPIIGGIVGTQVGLRMAGRRVAERGGFSRLYAEGVKGDKMGTKKTLEEASGLLADVRRHGTGTDVRGVFGEVGAKYEEKDAFAIYDKASKRHSRQLDAVELPLLGGAILGASAGLGITGAGAMLLEQIRRAGNFEENRRQAEQARRSEAQLTQPAA